jgi:hypothetical protein
MSMTDSLREMTQSAGVFNSSLPAENETVLFCPDHHRKSIIWESLSECSIHNREQKRRKERNETGKKQRNSPGAKTMLFG